MMNSTFWSGKKVFVTGHTGFKGSWMCLWLQSMGAIVKGYALEAPTTPSLYLAANVEKGMESHIANVCDYSALLGSIQAFQPEVIFHMAAQPLVRLSYDMPIETYQTNVMGTVHLLEACRQVSSVRSIVNITSDKCYENKEWSWGYRENEPMGGYDPYSNSKGCAELVASAFRQSYFNQRNYSQHGVGLASVRAGNVIGGGDWALDRLIPDIISAFQHGQAVEIRSPHALRPWQHVLEPISGYILLAEKLYSQGDVFSEGWNFGPQDQDAQPVQNIVEILANRWGNGAKWFLSEGEHPHEAHYLKLDCSKAKARLNWQPVWDLEATLEKIVCWYKAWSDGQDMRIYTLSEIEEYTNVRTRFN